MPGRSLHGERGLKFHDAEYVVSRCDGRSPRGERGLKCCTFFAAATKNKSLPSRGAWIEIHRHSRGSETLQVAPPTGSVD